MSAYADAKEIGVHAMWQLQAKRTKLCKDYLDRWIKAGLDGILCKYDVARLGSSRLTRRVQVLQRLLLRWRTADSNTSDTRCDDLLGL